MKTHIRYIMAAGIAIAMSAVVSCVKESVGGEGSEIRFGVSTVYENGPATKTVYSGKDQNNQAISSTSTAERIDWVSTDKVRILCSQATLLSGSEKYADYGITPGDAGTSSSHGATINPVGNGLQWGSGTHNFYAVYPSYVQNSASTIAVNGTGATVTGSIPSSQSATKSGYVFKPDMNYAYMYAYKPGVSSGASVSLEFKPLVTAIEFTLLTKDGDPITSKLTSVKLSSSQTGSYLSGAFTASLTTTGLTALSKSNITGGGNEITITLPDGGVQLSTDPDEAYTVTFLTLPLAQTELTLTLGFADSSVRTLELKNSDTWITVPACRKTYIWKLDAPKTVGTYVFSVTNPTDLSYSGGTSTNGKVISYMYTGDTDIAANRTNVAWEVDGYYPTEADATAGTNKYGSISSTYLTAYTPASTSGGYSGNSVSIAYSAGSGTSATVDLATEITQRLKSNSGAYVQRGTSSSYWNLANPTTGARTAIAETANTYIVNAPGYYCIPLVMGNGIKNGSYNTTAWQQTNFVNYQGTSITSASSPLLQDTGSNPASAFIVWEEADMVTVANKTNWTLPSGCITSSSVSVGGSSKTIYWLNFRITSSIQQGCIVLAVTDGSSNVMWSWTIWVTDYVPQNYGGYSASSELADVECTYDASGNKVTFMPSVLGWVKTRATGTLYAGASVFVRLKQTGTTNYAVMEVTRPERSVVTGDRVGHCPYYQWGRKDALMPSNGTGNTLLSPLYGKYTSFLNTNSKQTMATAIKNPQMHYGYGGSSPNDWCSTSYNGWWCAGNTATSTDKVTVKTIYDPSPAGYTIPRYNAFLGFRIGTSGSTPNASGSFQKGYYFWSGYRSSTSASTSGMKTIFIPAMGYRLSTIGSLDDVASDGLCWSAVPDGTYRGRNLNFSSGSLYPQNRYYRSYGIAVLPTREQ